jgi:ferric-dicitrate binding protein FerR (iron transport regulator)
MKIPIRICGFISFLILISVAVQAQTSVVVKQNQGDARILSLRGKVSVWCPGQPDARYPVRGDSVASGCRIETGENSRLELLLPDQSVVRFSEKTTFVLERMEVTEKGVRNIRISIVAGRIWSSIRKALQAGDKFEISCHNAVAGVRGTTYRMNVHEDQSALVAVYQGEVIVSAVSDKPPEKALSTGAPRPVEGPRPIEGPRPVSMEQWSYVVRSMQQISISADGQAGKPESFTESVDMDKWVEWNKKRDKKQEP